MLGYALVGVGGVAVLVGGFLGLRALSKQRASNDLCPQANRCRGDGATLEDSARSAADVSTIAFAIGVASAGVGTYLILSNHAVVAPTAGRDGGGVSVTGHF